MKLPTVKSLNWTALVLCVVWICATVAAVVTGKAVCLSIAFWMSCVVGGGFVLLRFVEDKPVALTNDAGVNLPEMEAEFVHAPESPTGPVPAAIAGNSPSSLEVVSLNASRFNDWRELLSTIEGARQAVAKLYPLLGLDQVKLCQGHEGETGEYLCERCGLDWLATEKLPCVNCYPIKLAIAGRLGAESAAHPLPGMDDRWQQAAADVLRLHALNCRSQAVEAPMRLSRPQEEIDAIAAKLTAEAVEIEALMEGIRAGDLRHCRWMPLGKARAFRGRIYLFSGIDSEGVPSGSLKLARLDPALGWIAESLDGGGDDLRRRGALDAAVFLLPGHP